MRANVWIGNSSRINLTSNYNSGAPDRITLLPIRDQKVCKRLLRNASHEALASIQFFRIHFQFSHRGVIRLAGFGNSRIGQLDTTDVRQLKCMRWSPQEHYSRPTGFYSKPESGSLRLHHLVRKVTGTVACHPWLGADFHCRSVLIAA